jgi:hypothetical protein
MNRRSFLSLFALAPWVTPALVNTRGGVFAADVQKAGILFSPHSHPLGDFLVECGADRASLLAPAGGQHNVVSGSADILRNGRAS